MSYRHFPLRLFFLVPPRLGFRRTNYEAAPRDHHHYRAIATIAKRFARFEAVVPLTEVCPLCEVPSDKPMPHTATNSKPKALASI